MNGFWGFGVLGLPKVFFDSRPRPPKVPSAAVQWGVALATRYPGVCRVWAITMLVFELWSKYCGRLGAFFDDL